MTAGPKAILLLVDGPRGTDGADGSRGGDAHFPGNDGADAGDAGPATRGMRGGQVDLFLSSSASSSDVSPASVHVSAKTVDALGAVRAVDEQVPFPDFRSVVTSARGGDGGHGGNGGRGGDGARGKKGADATRHSSGGNGGRGGDGGDGGIGTSGAGAGDGGTIRVFVDDSDTYLLMAVEGADAPDARVEGGKGGQAGLHGEGGRGGAGGPGGDSYSWTETEWRTERYTDSNGDRQTRTVSYTTHHRNPGGSRGWPGSDGRTPATPRFHGRDGAHGSFEIHVTSDGERRVYPRRYDLALSSFSFVEPDAPDDDGIYEPGERIAITDLCFENTGRMPTPWRQRVRVTLLPGTHVLPLPEEAFLPMGIDVDSAVTVHDRLAFRIRDVDISKAGEPYIVTEQVRPRAEQLGQEHGDTTGRDAPFARAYENVTYSRLLAVRFPVENRGGIRALRSLAPGEQTRIDFETRNISAKDLGRSSTRGRPLALRLEHVGGDVPPGSVLFHDESGGVHDFSLGSASAGYFFELPFLEARGSHIVSGHVGFTKDVRLYAHARLRYTILLDDLGPDEKLRVVQAREIELRVEPGYRWEPDTRVLLVTNNNTTREAYEAWHRLLEDELGLAVDDWSLTRYGHFDHKEPLPDGTDLYTHLEDKVVVLLNHPFHPRSDDVTEQPADYLRGRDFRRGATSNNTHTLLVGGEFNFRQLLEPTDDVRVGGDDFDSEGQFLKRERTAAGPLVQETFKEDITNIFDVVGVEKLTFPFLAPKPYALRQRALKLQKRLARLHPNRRYVLVHKDKAPERRGSFLGVIPRWDIGELEVRRTLNDESSSGVVVRTERVNDSAYILSPEARFAVALSLPFEGKLDRLSWLLLRPGDEFDADQRAMADALVAAMLVDLAEEQAALRRRRDDVSEEVMREKLSCLGRLLSHPLPTELAAGSNRWECLFALVSGLKALVESHSPWWRVVGRGARINRFTAGCVERLIDGYFNGYALDPHGEVAMESDTARARIALMSSGVMARVTGLHGHWRVQGRRASLGEAALHLLQHPEVGAAISRDIDAWQVAEERVWSGHDFERAQVGERGRVAAQDELKRQNVEEREALLRVPVAPVADEEAAVEAEVEVQAISRA